MNKHSDYWCKKYQDEAMPDENGNCSLCGAKLVSYYTSTGMSKISAHKLDVLICKAIDNGYYKNEGVI